MCCGRKKLAKRNVNKMNLGKKLKKKRSVEPIIDLNLNLPINQDISSIPSTTPPYDVHLI